jgi:hypothetical protein
LRTTALYNLLVLGLGLLESELTHSQIDLIVKFSLKLA